MSCKLAAKHIPEPRHDVRMTSRFQVRIRVSLRSGQGFGTSPAATEMPQVPEQGLIHRMFFIEPHHIIAKYRSHSAACSGIIPLHLGRSKAFDVMSRLVLPAIRPPRNETHQCSE